jgi:hypothetical protein
MAFPATSNINYYHGDTYEFNIYPKIATGAVFDMTGYSVSFNIATSTGASPSFTVGATALIDATHTYISCKILPTTGTQLIPGTLYYYDVQISKGSSVYTLLKGNVVVTADVSGA